jgi:hypothetical protein
VINKYLGENELMGWMGEILWAYLNFFISIKKYLLIKNTLNVPIICCCGISIPKTMAKKIFNFMLIDCAN